MSNMIDGVKLTGKLGDMVKKASGTVAKAYNESMKKRTVRYTKVFTEETIDGLSEKLGRIGGASALQKLTEGNAIPELQIAKGNSVDVEPVDVGGRITMSRKLLRNLAFRNLIQTSALLASQVYQQKEKTAWSVLAGGFSSTRDVTLGNDVFSTFGAISGKNLFSLTHETATGDTYANTTATQVPLTDENLVDAKALSMDQPALNGDIPGYGMDGFILVVPTALKNQAERIVKSTQVAGSNYNDLSLHGDVEVLAVPQLGLFSKTAWFLVAKNKEDHGLTFAASKYEDFDDGFNEDMKSYFADVSISIVAGWLVPTGIYGSKGDGSTYSA